MGSSRSPLALELPNPLPKRNPVAFFLWLQVSLAKSTAARFPGTTARERPRGRGRAAPSDSLYQVRSWAGDSLPLCTRGDRSALRLRPPEVQAGLSHRLPDQKAGLAKGRPSLMTGTGLLHLDASVHWPPSGPSLGNPARSISVRRRFARGPFQSPSGPFALLPRPGPLPLGFSSYCARPSASDPPQRDSAPCRIKRRPANASFERASNSSMRRAMRRHLFPRSPPLPESPRGISPITSVRSGNSPKPWRNKPVAGGANLAQVSRQVPSRMTTSRP